MNDTDSENTFHADRALARAAELSDIILHGTATLAHGVTAVVNEHVDGRPELVRRITGRFAALVQLPSTITINIVNIVNDGFVVLGSAASIGPSGS